MSSAAIFLLALVSIAFTVLRFHFPTDPVLSWDETFKAAAHIFVGMMVLRLVQLRGRWPLGWICLSTPTMLELVMFLAARG